MFRVFMVFIALNCALYSEEIATSTEEIVQTLEDVGKNYIALLNRMGNEKTLSYDKEVSALCAPQCKKIVNSAVWFEGREHFVPQLLATREKLGSWSITPLDIIPSQDGRTVVLRFLVLSENRPLWNTLVILRCNEELLITEINEVFNNYEGSTN